MFDNIREDWAMHDRCWTRAGFWTLAVYRFGQWRDRIQWRPLRLPFSFAYRNLFMLVRVITGITLPGRTQIGRRLRFDHSGGIIIHEHSIIGDDCLIRHGVTIGVQRTGETLAPRLGNRVDIGCGAVLLGPITIGDDVVIGANSVVLCDVPACSTAVGVPARVLPRKALLSSKQQQ